MTERDKDIEALDALFGTARDQARAPDDAFMARLTAEATIAADSHAEAVRPRPAPDAQRPSFWTRLFPVSGLTAATLAGLWIGMALPDSEFGETYLANIGASGEMSDFVPTFEVGALEDDG